MTGRDKPITASSEADDELIASNATRSFLKYAIRVLLVGSCVSLVLQRIVIPDQSIRSIGPGLTLLVTAAAWYLLSHKKIQAAIHVLTIGVWTAITVVIAITNGVLSPMICAYPVLILCTGWLIGPGAALIMTVVTVIVTASLAVSEVLGILTTTTSAPLLLSAGMESVVFIIAGLFVTSAMRLNQHRLEELRRVGRELTQRTVELEVTQAELNAAQGVATVGSWVYSFPTDIFEMSAESSHIFNWPKAPNASIATFLALVHPDDRATVQRAWQAATGGAIFDVEHRVALNQQTHWIRSKAELTFAANGTPVSAVGISQDITERKLTLLALRDSESRYRIMIESSPQPVLVHRLGKILYANASAARMFGASETHALASRSTSELIHPDYRQSQLERINSITPLERIEPMVESKFLKLDGTVIDVEVQGTSIIYDNKPAIHVAIHDITEHKKNELLLIAAKSEAQKANSDKSTFLSAVGHDLGQPLSALSLLVGVIKRNAPPESIRLIENMQACVDGMSGLLNDLMEVSKLDAAVVLPKPSNFSVDDMLASIASVQSVEARMKGLELRVRPSDAFAYTDFKLMQRIIGNLVSNAIRYTSTGGVLMACRVHASRHWVEVWDTGIGIPMDKTEVVFEEFTQIKDATRTLGSGLGLSIVAKTARLLGLQVRMHSKVGKGSMFAVELPLGRALEGTSRQNTSTKPRPARIGLVDDNTILLESLVYALEDADYEVIAATNKSELLKSLGNQAPDMVISDYCLAGGETGIDVIDSTRKAFGDGIPCLIITADTQAALRIAMTKQRIAVLYKPLETGVFLAFIKEATERRHSLD